MGPGARVGVLALQGDFAPHRAAFARLGHDAAEVRAPRDLDGLTHLVLPGGESTTLRRLMGLFGLDAAVVERHRAGELALFGTCAGAILLGRAPDARDALEHQPERPPRLGLLDATVERNAYGRQIDSFERAVRIDALGRTLRCPFIRAPRITAVGSGVEVLARDGRDPVLVRAPGVLAATFHPELSGDSGVHELFLTACAVSRAM